MAGLGTPLADPPEAIIDIVFIHGLHGNRMGTWTKYGICWPESLLPPLTPRARILSWGYDSFVSHFWSRDVSQNELNNHSISLCSDLAGLRGTTNSSNRPIIFVVHSLGGLVCANAQLLAQNTPEKHLEDIAKSTRGIIFLGTPHEGSSKAKWAIVGQNFIRLFKDINGEILKVLEADSQKLSDVGDGFSMLLRRRGESSTTSESKIEIICFYEEYKSAIGMIVPKESAKLAGYDLVPIPADHQDMCKFASQDDIGFKRVSEVLVRWIKKLETPVDEDTNAKTTNTANFYGSNYGMMFGQVDTRGAAFHAPLNLGTWNAGSTTENQRRDD